MATQKRRIVGGIMQGRKTYVAGDEDKLAEVLSPRSIQRLLEKGQLEGDWGVPMVDRGPVDAVSAQESVTVTAENFTATPEPKAAPARKPAARKSQSKKGR